VILKAGPEALTDLAKFLNPFAALLQRSQSRHALEGYTTGLLADLPRKTASDLGRAIAGTNGQRLQEFLTRTQWDPSAMDRLRVRQMGPMPVWAWGDRSLTIRASPKKGPTR
jgi:SRSO17 transposase